MDKNYVQEPAPGIIPKVVYNFGFVAGLPVCMNQISTEVAAQIPGGWPPSAPSAVGKIQTEAQLHMDPVAD